MQSNKVRERMGEKKEKGANPNKKNANRKVGLTLGGGGKGCKKRGGGKVVPLWLKAVFARTGSRHSLKEIPGGKEKPHKVMSNWGGLLGKGQRAPARHMSEEKSKEKKGKGAATIGLGCEFHTVATRPLRTGKG